jgi:hypothetical protein
MHEDSEIIEHICAVTQATEARRETRLQTLWSGWGEIVRFALRGASVPSVIVKRVCPPADDRHPRGWRSDRSAARKARSYDVERAFYGEHASRCPARLPGALYLAPGLFILEDLDVAGFSGRAVGAGSLSMKDVQACLSWLADFHASNFGVAPEGLWPVGTYWHLQTRPDELASMPTGPLKSAAADIDARLSSAHYLTLVHGDAKVANFCFGPTGVAALDFQYVGGGCGMKDVAYFLGSCLADDDLHRRVPGLLDHYFGRLRAGLPGSIDHAAVETEWRSLMPMAWADFERFLAGWAPEHWKRGGYAATQTASALAGLR